MQEEFEAIRDFHKKYPGKLYICPRCGHSTPNPIICTSCELQSNSFLYKDKIYTYTIKETGETAQIFKPIEMEKTCNKQ